MMRRYCVLFLLRVAGVAIFALPLVVAISPMLLGGQSPEVLRWESAIRAFEAADEKDPPPKDATLFLGSSSIRKWQTLKEDFLDRETIRRGFGGSHISDCLAYADRIVMPYEPDTIVLYAGDNDLAAGKKPDRVVADFRAFVRKVHRVLPETEIAFIAIKPSIARWHLLENIRETNRAIEDFTQREKHLHYIDIFQSMLGPDGYPREELLAEDGLHLSRAGYELWTEKVKAVLR